MGSELSYRWSCELCEKRTDYLVRLKETIVRMPRRAQYGATYVPSRTMYGGATKVKKTEQEKKAHRLDRKIANLTHKTAMDAEELQQLQRERSTGALASIATYPINVAQTRERARVRRESKAIAKQLLFPELM